MRQGVPYTLPYFTEPSSIFKAQCCSLSPVMLHKAERTREPPVTCHDVCFVLVSFSCQWQPVSTASDCAGDNARQQNVIIKRNVTLLGWNTGGWYKTSWSLLFVCFRWRQACGVEAWLCLLCYMPTSCTCVDFAMLFFRKCSHLTPSELGVYLYCMVNLRLY